MPRGSRSRAVLSIGGLAAVVGVTCAASVPARDEAPPALREVAVEVAIDAPIAEIDSRFLSFAVDTAQLVGGTFWSRSGEVEIGRGRERVAEYPLEDPRVRALASELAPAYLRIGGSDADRTFYDLGAAPVREPPAGYEWVMTAAHWDRLQRFVREVGLDLMFTVNGGPGPVRADGSWDDTQARALLDHAAARGDAVALWELGNEPNAFPLIHGLGFDPDAETLADAQRRFASLVRARFPEARIGGPAPAYWPRAGEIHAAMPDLLPRVGDVLDVVTWHYYPQQSRRCPIAVRRAGPLVMMEPAHLDEIDRWADEVQALRDAHAPHADVALGESGNAQCGGEPGVSDTFAGTFWWLDQLGRMARRGQQFVVRQTLSGSDYGLLDDVTHAPRPDYWASLLWRRLVGTRVLRAEVFGAGEGGQTRVYAHCARDAAPGAIVLLAINVSMEQAARVDLGSLGHLAREVYAVTASALDARTISLGNAPLELRDDGSLPALEPTRDAVPSSPFVDLPARSWAFVVIPDADADACR